MSSSTIEIETLTATTLEQAEAGSYFTIAGAGGDLSEWVEGIGKMLDEAGIARPSAWFQTTGESINAYATRGGGVLAHRDAFQDDLTVLMFALDGMDVGKLAIFKVRFEARWFDDVIANMTVVHA